MKNFYVDINSIIDARAGVIKRLAPELYTEIIQNGYHTRKGDFFKGIDPAKYREMYEANEIETLMAGTMTNVFHFIYPHVLDIMKEFVAKEEDSRARPMLDVNVFPYDYTEDEMAFLRTVVYSQMRGIVGVRVFKKDLAELTPAHCAEAYFMMVTYDYDRYLNAHSSELIRAPIPQMILAAPMVYFNTNPDEDEETISQLSQGINSLALLETAIAPRICLKFLNPEVFSIVYPDDRVLEIDVPNTENQMSLDDLEKILQSHRDKRIPEA